MQRGEIEMKKWLYKVKNFYWFTAKSYKYINPKSIKEWKNFIIEFPTAWKVFYRQIEDDS
jgi:hypothetical protein